MKAMYLWHVGALAATMVVSTSICLALNILVPNDETYNDPRGPQAYNRVINKYKRVYGFSGSDHGSHFYFEGNAKHLNAFLAQLAEAKEGELVCTLVPGPGSVKPAWWAFEQKDKAAAINYNWAVHMPARIVVGAKPPAAGEGPDQTMEGTQTTDGSTRDEPPTTTKVRWACGDWINVEVHLHGPISLQDLVLPLAYEADVGGRIGRFADGHNNRRKIAQEPDTRAEDRKPTTEAILNAQGLFGAGELELEEDSETWDRLLENLMESLPPEPEKDSEDSAGRRESKPE